MVSFKLSDSFLLKNINRTITSFIVLFFLISVIFFLTRIMPGDPFQQYYSPQLGFELAEKMKEQFGFNEPISIQYFKWLKNFFSGDFGYSSFFKRPVKELIKESLPITLSISFSAFIIQIIVTIPLSLFMLKHANKKIDLFIDKFALVVYSAPAFLIASLLIYIFSIVLQIFPSSQLISTEFNVLSFQEKVIDVIKHIILPISTLAITSIAFSIRYLRENLIKVSHEPFIKSLRALGINETKIRIKHILPNALIPYITILGLEFGSLLSRTLIIESIFSIPGIGFLTVNSIFTRDYPLILSTTILSGIMIILGNLLADMVIAKINPQISDEQI